LVVIDTKNLVINISHHDTWELRTTTNLITLGLPNIVDTKEWHQPRLFTESIGKWNTSSCPRWPILIQIYIKSAGKVVAYTKVREDDATTKIREMGCGVSMCFHHPSCGLG
jgi:hypothetical protein